MVFLTGVAVGVLACTVPRMIKLLRRVKDEPIKPCTRQPGHTGPCNGLSCRED